jgi:hypothetical protein
MDERGKKYPSLHFPSKADFFVFFFSPRFIFGSAASTQFREIADPR